jgi:DNA polymerase
LSHRLSVLNRVEEEWSRCTRCDLHRTRSKVSFWRGNPDARLIIIGSAPDNWDDKSGRPFTGPSGRLLDAALKDAGLNPAEDVWIANQLGCRTPAGRKPLGEELYACSPRLYRLVFPLQADKFALLLGPAAGAMLAMVEDLAAERLRAREEERVLEVEIFSSANTYTRAPGMITFHPTFVLMTGGKNSHSYGELVKDIKLAYIRANSTDSDRKT